MGGVSRNVSSKRPGSLIREEDRERLLAEGGSCVFQPHTVLPAQFFSVTNRHSEAQGERRLYAAVLEDAVECYQNHFFTEKGKSRQLHSDAEKWLFSDDDSWPFAFLNVCEVLNLQPTFLRQGLRRWRQYCESKVRKPVAKLPGLGSVPQASVGAARTDLSVLKEAPGV